MNGKSQRRIHHNNNNNNNSSKKRPFEQKGSSLFVVQAWYCWWWSIIPLLFGSSTITSSLALMDRPSSSYKYYSSSSRAHINNNNNNNNNMMKQPPFLLSSNKESNLRLAIVDRNQSDKVFQADDGDADADNVLGNLKQQKDQRGKKLLSYYESKHPDATIAAERFVKSLAMHSTTTTTKNIDCPTYKKMIVFDKDGTLGDCTSSLRKWVHHMTDRIRNHVDQNTGNHHDENNHDDDDDTSLMAQFYDQIGWDVTKNNVIPSAPVAAGTWNDIVGIVAGFLRHHQHSFRFSSSSTTNKNDDDKESNDHNNNNDYYRVLAQEWHDDLGNVHAYDTPVMEDLASMMKQCQQMGYTVAICTSDDRQSTNVALESWDIHNVVEFSICGDEVISGKPSAVPLETLCERVSKALGYTLAPHDCIVVGDTSADTGMARAAQAGFCVGVLTGSGTTTQLLETGAHLIVPSVAHIPALLETFEQWALIEQEKAPSQ